MTSVLVSQRRTRGRLTLLALLVTALVAQADNTADEADLAFTLGNEAYAKRNYDHALAAYFLSYRLVPNRNVLFNIARCFEAQSRFDEAYRYWYDLSVDKGLPEGDRRDVKQAMARLSGRVALVSVTSNPPGAELYVDRKDLGSRGRTPQTIAVAAGAHALILELPGYKAMQLKASTSVGREARLDAVLTRIVGHVALSGTPSHATVHEAADAKALGTLPVTLDFPPGQRLLVVQAPGYLSQQVLVDVTAEETVSAKVTLPERPQATGKLVVTANRENALVVVDGRRAGFTPTVVTLPVGDHELEVSSDDTTPFSGRVKIELDAEVRVPVELRYAPPPVRAASKTALSVDQAPASVTVITREELLNFGYQSLAEALRAVRGLFLTDDRLYTYIGLRGFQPPGDLNTRLLILWDGHPTNDIWAGQGFSARDLDVDLSEVDRIEVVRGPASILFGTGAFFGVINVVPRAHLSGTRNVEGVIGGGGQNGGKLRVTGGLEGQTAAVLASAAGFLSEGAAVTDLEQGPVRGLDGERSLGATVHARAGDFTLLGKINQRRKQAPTAPLGAAFGVPGTEYTDARGFAELRFQHTWDKLTLDARASYDASRYRGYYAQLDDNGNHYRTTDSGGGDWFGAEVRGGLQVFGQNRLTVSLEGSVQLVTQQSVELSTPDLHTRVVLSATVLDEWQMHPRFFLQAGVRLDKYFDLPDLALSPRGALVARLYDSGITKVVVGQAFRAPTFYELYFQDNFLTQHPPTTPLRPELITTFELEHSHDFTPELRATLGGYVNLIDRLVIIGEESSMSPQCGGDMPVQCLVYANSPRNIWAGGVEGQLRWQPGRFTLVDASYSFVVLRAGSRETYAWPMHMAAVRALVPIVQGFVRLSGQATYQSARRGPDGIAAGESLLLNFGFAGDYGPLRYFAGVQNLLDQRYSLPVSSEVGSGRVPQYGRTYFIELSAGF